MSWTIAASMPRSIASPRNIERVDELGRLDEDVEREVDAPAALVREAARLAELVEGELRAFVARVEALGAQIDGVGAVGDARRARRRASRRGRGAREFASGEI